MKRFVLRFARTWLGGLLVSWIFSNMSFVLPVRRLHETDNWLAFHHPQPSHEVHILIVSKRNYYSILDVPSSDSAFLQDLLELVGALVRELDLEQHGYRLLTNGGVYQDVDHLHFHLISDTDQAS